MVLQAKIYNAQDLKIYLVSSFLLLFIIQEKSFIHECICTIFSLVQNNQFSWHSNYCSSLYHIRWQKIRVWVQLKKKKLCIIQPGLLYNAKEMNIRRKVLLWHFSACFSKYFGGLKESCSANCAASRTCSKRSSVHIQNTFIQSHEQFPIYIFKSHYLLNLV